MSREVNCPVCSKRYVVTAGMEGHRVRCRQCATVFAIEPTEVSRALIDAGVDPETGALSAPSLPDAQDQFEQAVNRSEHAPKFRANTKFKFPRAAELDTWLPPALLLIGTLWATRETFKSDIGPVWAGLIRLIAIFGCYIALVVPLTLMGIRRVARHLLYTLPPQPVYRTAAAFALPATLGYVTWVALGSVASLFVGVILGLCFGAAAFWLLFRLELKELGKSFAAAAGSFAGSLVACGIILLLLNLVLNGSLRKAHVASLVKISPMGPSFAWQGDDVLPVVASKETPQNDPTATDTGLFRSEMAGKSNTEAAVAATDPPNRNQPTIPIATSINSPAARSANSRLNGKDNQSTPGTSVTGTSDHVAASPVPAAVASLPDHPITGTKLFEIPLDESPTVAQPMRIDPPTTAAAPDSKIIAALKDKSSPFVLGVRSAGDLGNFDELVYPATTSPWMAVVRHKDSDQDAVELRDAKTFELSATVLFPREHGGTTSVRHFALSPNGQYIVRPSTFPKSGFQVWSFHEQRVSKRVDLDDGTNTPELLGFIDNDHFLTQCQRNGGKVLEVREIRPSGPMRLRSIAMPAYTNTLANGQISPDGKWFAFAARVKNQANLYLVDALHNTLHPPFPITSLGERWPVDPVGIAFSRDGSRVAALFANQGEGYVVSWLVKENRSLPDQVCPGISVTGGRVFDWVGNYAWLISGTSLVDATSGKLLERLFDTSIKGQAFVEAGIGQVQFTEQGQSRVAIVEFDQDKLTPTLKR